MQNPVTKTKPSRSSPTVQKIAVVHFATSSKILALIASQETENEFIFTRNHSSTSD